MHYLSELQDIHTSIALIAHPSSEGTPWSTDHLTLSIKLHSFFAQDRSFLLIVFTLFPTASNLPPIPTNAPSSSQNSMTRYHRRKWVVPHSITHSSGRTMQMLGDQTIGSILSTRDLANET